MRQKQLIGLNVEISRQARWIQGVGYAVEIFHQMRQNDEDIDDYWIAPDVVSAYQKFMKEDDQDRWDQLMACLPPRDHLAAIQYLIKDMQNGDLYDLERLFLLAILTEAAGDTAEALAIYQRIDQHEYYDPRYFDWSERLSDAITRLSPEGIHHPTDESPQTPPSE